MQGITMATRRTPLPSSPTTCRGATGETETETAPDASGESTRRGGAYNGQGCLGLVTRAQSKVTRLVHTRNRKYPHQHIGEQKSRVVERAYVRLTVAQDKDAMTFVECQDRTPFDIMEASLWRETPERCLGSYFRRDLRGEPRDSTGCREQTVRLHMLLCPKVGWKYIDTQLDAPKYSSLVLPGLQPGHLHRGYYALRPKRPGGARVQPTTRGHNRQAQRALPWAWAAGD